MEWTTLPPVDWWLLLRGVLWAVFWVTVVLSLLWAMAYVINGRKGSEPDRQQPPEQWPAPVEIRREELGQARRDIGDTHTRR